MKLINARMSISVAIPIFSPILTAELFRRPFSAELTGADFNKPANIRYSTLRSSGVKYKCELEPQWLTANIEEKAQIGRVHIRNYENGLIRNRRFKILKIGKRKFSEM
jgi:hypothetical protein